MFIIYFKNIEIDWVKNGGDLSIFKEVEKKNRENRLCVREVSKCARTYMSTTFAVCRSVLCNNKNLMDGNDSTMTSSE